LLKKCEREFFKQKAALGAAFCLKIDGKRGFEHSFLGIAL
jgi:hypothetical protein